MSREIYEVIKYDCNGDCNIPMGCKDKNILILETNKDYDIQNLFIKRHINDNDSKLELIGEFTISDLKAIGILANSKGDVSIDGFWETKEGELISNEIKQTK